MIRRAPSSHMRPPVRGQRSTGLRSILCLLPGVCIPGCTQFDRGTAVEVSAEAARVVVVAPVQNLSNRADWDPLQFTDMLASELQTFPGFLVVPVNRTLAALQLLGQSGIETPADAELLADELDADLVLVAAITEYQPFSPPRVGLVMQLYAARKLRRSFTDLDPVAASRSATEFAPAGFAEARSEGPVWQSQRVVDGSDHKTLEAVKRYAATRPGHNSPYAWRVHLQRQELFVRFSFWTSIVPMQEEWRHYRRDRSLIEKQP